MTDNEIINAVANLLEPIKSDIQEMKNDIQGLKGDVQGLKGDVQGLKGDVQDLKEDMSEVKTRVKKIELTQENDILPRLHTIEACYTTTFDRYRASVEDYEEMKQDISVLKVVVADHSERLQRIS